MKKSIRIVALLLVLLVSLSTFTGCIFGPEKLAEITVDTALSKLKNADIDDIREVLQLSENEDAGLPADIYTESMIMLLVKNFDYEIVSSEAIDDEHVEVTVSVTNTDMIPVVEDFIAELTAYALKNLGEISSMTEEESAKVTLEILEECLSKEDLETTTKEVVFHVNKVDGEWTIDMQDTVVDAIFGGIKTAFENADLG